VLQVLGRAGGPVLIFTMVAFIPIIGFSMAFHMTSVPIIVPICLL
jgi:hypothetical protein